MLFWKFSLKKKRQCIKEEEIPATREHSWDKGAVTKEPTCTTAGEALYTCVHGDTKTEVIPNTPCEFIESESTAEKISAIPALSSAPKRVLPSVTISSSPLYSSNMGKSESFIDTFSERGISPPRKAKYPPESERMF